MTFRPKVVYFRDETDDLKRKGFVLVREELLSHTALAVLKIGHRLILEARYLLPILTLESCTLSDRGSYL